MTALALGTAQFGTGYGITNDNKRLDSDSVRAILLEAAERGVAMFDSAAEYGDAQDRLGELMPASSSPAYVTKFALKDESLPKAEDIYGDSMRRLKTSALHGLLFHRMSDLLDPRFDETVEILRGARSSGQVRRIGVSIYDISELELAASKFPDFDIVQVPGSIVDMRLLGHPLLAQLRSRGVEVHVRSAFLQGLLLQPVDLLDQQFAALRPVLSALDEAAHENGTDRMSLLLGALRAHPCVDVIVLGATSVAELQTICSTWDRRLGPAHLELPDVPLSIADPRQWTGRTS